MATPFHRLARETPEHRWWKLPVAGLVAVIGWFAVTIAVIVWAIIGLELLGEDGPGIVEGWVDSGAELDLGQPGFFALSMLTIVVMLPALLLAVFAIGPRPIGYLTSVEGRMRWGWLALMLLVAFVIFGAGIGGLVMVSDADDVSSARLDSDAVVALILVLALTPLQATAEEYVFRGYLLQLVGSWTRFAIVPVLVSVPVFTAGHGYELWGLVDVAVFGLTAGYLVIRTGGLEAAIAAHVANNVVLLAFDAVGVFATSDEDAGPLDVVPTVVMCLLMCGAVELLVRRCRIVRTRPPIIPAQGMV